VRRTKLFSTSSFRLTLLYAGLFSGSVLILFVAIYVALAGYMARQLDRAIDAEISVLGDEARVVGTGRLAALIAERAATTPRTGTVYLLQDAEGRLLAGDLRPRRAVVGWLSFRGRSRAAEGDGPHRIRARGVRLDDGSYLLIGQDASPLDEVQELIVRAFAWSAAATLVLALAGGMLMSAGVLRRVGAIARASQAVMAGDLTQRVPSRGVGDEFDQLADALNAMIARIETLMEGLRQISNDIAHDLRTPLSRLRQRLEAVQRGSPALADYERLVDRAIRDADTILDTFAAMLRIAEVEAANRHAGFADVDLSEILHTVLEVYEPLAAERSDALSGEIAPGLAVRGDRELLTQLFANLVQNALMHTPPGIRVTVTASRTSGAVAVVVADSGPGIPEAEHDKVFRRFYRLEASRGTPGSGLGLSLVGAIAALHGAAVALSDNLPGLRIELQFRSEPPSAEAR
jgi:signal transduction histidine kinase